MFNDTINQFFGELNAINESFSGGIPTKQEDTQLLEDILAPNYLNPNSLDNLFNANHRGAMKSRYGYTEAEDIEIDELNFQFGRPELQNENLEDLIF